MRGLGGLTIAGSLLVAAALTGGCATGAKATGQPSRMAWAELTERQRGIGRDRPCSAKKTDGSGSSYKSAS